MAPLNKLNYEYNEIEELRAEPHEQSNRHFELFRERSRFTGWLFTISLAVAFVVLFKVLTPFQDLNEQRVARSNEMAALKNRRTELHEHQGKLAVTAEHFADVQEKIRKAPWRRTPEKLVATMRQLNRAYRVLLEATDDELKRSMQDRETTQSVGFADDGIWTLPASFQFSTPQEVNANWKLPTDADEESPLGSSDQTSLDAEQMLALQNYFDAIGALRQMGLVGDEYEFPATTAADADIRLEIAQSDEEPAWMSLPPPTIDESVQTLHVLPNQLLELKTFRERDTLLFGVLEERAQEEAHKLLDEVYHAVTNSIVTPLRNTLDHVRGSELAHIAEGFEELETSLDEWRSSHKAESNWYHTVSSKGQTVNDLSVSVGNVLAATSIALKLQSAALRVERVQSAERIQSMEEEREALTASQAAISAKLDGIMPPILMGVIEARELIQIFPMLLILLVIALGYNVWSVRDHFLHSIIHHEDEGPHTSASLWTLVRRGKFRTLITLSVMLGGTGLLWFTYEQGALLMTRWAALDGSQAWAFTGSISEAAPWMGRTVFLVAASGIVLALLWREHSEAMPEEVPELA
ncbi:MAG: putative translin family RNA/ssDNA-binding protein [Planctomycetota bacterium]|jgi:predicted translin family RNA/ssDNA-binding protein